ncbi:aldose epimerase family protein [Cupriavidus pauculus]|uniref:Aldose epimerase n=1 Tax=Cupriavidus pauculus TaxID=82633 RepID=A0A2N5CH88_9BURK|nr:aldose epimerase [Cupriavidus pauculus]PLQ01573.1 aldose epimerase [Cupriavidus pauculus]
MTTTQRFQSQDLLRVGHDDHYLLLAPAHGGRLVRWVHRGQDILYWPDDADWTRVAKVRGGNPLLFPFIGRHFVDGEAGRWRDAAGVVHALPQHGFARDLPFAVSALSAEAVSLSLASSDLTRPGYPFGFVFTATYRLLADGIEATLHTRNTGDAALPALPYYAGHHFYFALPHPARAQSRIVMPPASRVRQQADGSLTVPEPGEPGEPAYRLDDPRLQDTFHVLQAKGNGDIGSVCVELPTRTIEIGLDATNSPPWYAVTTWTERDDSDFYCVEPWLGLPNAIHHGQGLRWVPGGAKETATCRLTIR